RRRGRGRRRWRSRMGESAVFLDELPRLAKSGYRFLFVGSGIDRNGDDLVEPISAHVRTSSTNAEAATPPKLVSRFRSSPAPCSTLRAELRNRRTLANL